MEVIATHSRMVGWLYLTDQASLKYKGFPIEGSQMRLIGSHVNRTRDIELTHL